MQFEDPIIEDHVFGDTVVTAEDVRKLGRVIAEEDESEVGHDLTEIEVADLGDVIREAERTPAVLPKMDVLGGALVAVSNSKDEQPTFDTCIGPERRTQPNFALLLNKRVASYEEARPGWDWKNLPSESVVMGTIDPFRHGTGFQRAVSCKPSPESTPETVLDIYDVPFTYGAFLDAKVEYFWEEMKNKVIGDPEDAPAFRTLMYRPKK